MRDNEFTAYQIGRNEGKAQGVAITLLIQLVLIGVGTVIYFLLP